MRGFLADRPHAVAALTRIFLAEIERLLVMSAGVTPAAATPNWARPITQADLAAVTERVRRRINSGFFSRSGEDRRLGVADLSSLAVSDGVKVSDWGTWIREAVNIGADNTVTFVTRSVDDTPGFMTTP